MAIDWNDNKKRKALRKALQAVYPSLEELQIFVGEELGQNLATIAGPGNLQVTTYKLLEWGKAKGRLDDIYESFCSENSNNALIAELQQEQLISTNKLTQILDTEWSELFAEFGEDDAGAILTGFFAGFEQVFASKFSDKTGVLLTDAAEVRDWLEKYQPELAVRFVECVITQIRRSDNAKSRDLGPLQQWRDRIAKQFNISLQTVDGTDITKIKDKPLCYGYFLIAIDASHGDGNLIVYPELHVTGRASAIPLQISPTRCSIDGLLAKLPDWIKRVEKQLYREQYNLADAEVVLELFLPSSYLGQDLDNWTVEEDDTCMSLMSHRRLILRSWERIHDQTLKKLLRKRWDRLRDSSKETVCQRFHLQEELPTIELVNFLKDYEDEDNQPLVGLKLVSALPRDSSEQDKIFQFLRKVPVPIVLWSCNPDISGKDVLEPKFDELLETSRLEHFAHLAKQWRLKRGQSSMAKPVRLLCDCPDRIPTNVPKNEDTDFLVA